MSHHNFTMSPLYFARKSETKLTRKGQRNLFTNSTVGSLFVQIRKTSDFFAGKILKFEGNGRPVSGTGNLNLDFRCSRSSVLDGILELPKKKTNFEIFESCKILCSTALNQISKVFSAVQAEPYLHSGMAHTVWVQYLSIRRRLKKFRRGLI